jgi:hypothetical protein
MEGSQTGPAAGLPVRDRAMKYAELVQLIVSKGYSAEEAHKIIRLYESHKLVVIEGDTVKVVMDELILSRFGLHYAMSAAERL